MAKRQRPQKQKTERVEPENTRDEIEAACRYLDLRLQAFRIYPREVQVREFAQGVVDLSRLFETSKTISAIFKEDLRDQIDFLERQHLAFEKALGMARRLRDESGGGLLVSHVYQMTREAIDQAIVLDVPDRALEYPIRILRDHLSRLIEASG